MHIAQIDLETPGLRFKVSPPSGDREVVRQSTLAFLKQERAQLAINGHFFLPFPSADRTAWVIGLAASEGRVYSAFESPEQRYALVVNAPALNLDRRNRATIVHRDPSKPDGSHVRERVQLWNVVAGSSQIVTDGAATVPAYEDATHPAGLLKPGGPNNYSNAKAWDALNLDGGGSTSMAMVDPATGVASLANSSSDNNPAGREVATSLAVFARRR